ncbi:sugar transferase [Neobacillus niacini]|uniref:sugar transferase n=1 Tax=Neobacillus niacini TaxID=86668 RepID=UPI0007AB333B|nr:sugar transferase [Neobacillus niacini]MEC1525879.1 sugar transferase [Neobacillus niacini]
MNIKVETENSFQKQQGSLESPYPYIEQNTSTLDLQLFIKRIIDIVIALIGLIITAPILLITSIFVVLDSPGPVLFAQERVGLRGKYFMIYKIRSMVTDAEKNGATWAAKNDPRVTTVGKFIRKTRIDELPQLWNVLKGDMSIVGPRPEIPKFTIQFNEEIPGFVNRLSVKPGLTGWAQINGGYDLTPAQKLEKDMIYINNISLLLDIKIIFKTFFIVFNGKGAR